MLPSLAEPSPLVIIVVVIVLGGHRHSVLYWAIVGIFATLVFAVVRIQPVEENRRTQVERRSI